MQEIDLGPCNNISIHTPYLGLLSMFTISNIALVLVIPLSAPINIKCGLCRVNNCLNVTT